jgi:hypothetical protein
MVFDLYNRIRSWNHLFMSQTILSVVLWNRFFYLPLNLEKGLLFINILSISEFVSETFFLSTINTLNFFTTIQCQSLESPKELAKKTNLLLFPRRRHVSFFSGWFSDWRGSPFNVEKYCQHIGHSHYCSTFSDRVKINQCTVKLGYNELGYSEHSVVTNRFLSQIGHIGTQINPVITNPGYNEQKWPVPSCSL